MTQWDKSQLHLIRACLSQDAKNFSYHAAAWDRYLTIDQIDAASMRLIPLYFKLAQRYGVKIENEGICKGVYLKSWYAYKTQGLMPLGTLLEALGSHEAIFLKGVALRGTVYRHDPPTRPADDIDFLVQPSQARAVVETLMLRGFLPEAKLSIETFTSLRHGVNLSKGEVNLDVHWSVVPICLDPGYLTRIWTRCQEAENGVKVLSDTDSLIHCLIHGYGSNVIAPIRWIVDAALLIRKGGIDWALLSREIEVTGWGPMVRKQLQILSDYFGIETGQRFRPSRKPSYLAWVSRVYLRSESLFLRRALRVLGWDFGVYATNLRIRPTFVSFLRCFPQLVLAFLKEFGEYLSRAK